MMNKIVLLVLVFSGLTATGGTKLSFNDVLVKPGIDFLNKFSNNEKLTSACNNSINNIKNSSNINALKFFDASTKVPTGILDSTFFDLGNYEECMSIHDDFNGEDIYGKYCIGTVKLDISMVDKNHTNNNLRLLSTNHIGLHWAYCLPHTCTTKDFEEKISWSEFYDEYCYTNAETKSFDSADIVAIVILSIFLILVVASTVLDLSLQYLEKKPSTNLLLAFSIWTNGKKIIKTTRNPDQLSCLNGIRALSMVWVIYGHVATNVMSDAGLVSISDVTNFSKKFINMYLVSGTVSVDTFFTISGLLVMYLFMKSSDKGDKFTARKIPMFYIHRYLRLTPPVAILIMINASLIRYIGSGPFWGNAERFVSPCRTYWWAVLLYIQNYVNVDDECAGHTWYLSVDMQLFILTPIILIITQKYPKVGLASLLGVIVAGFIVPFTLTYTMDLSATLRDDDTEATAKYYRYYYLQTYARFGPYVIGMLFGWIIFKLKKQPDIIDLKIKNKLLVIGLLWVITIGGILGSTYGGYNVLISKATDLMSKSFYNGFHRNTWSISVGLVATLCCLGVGGPINGFLSLPLFQFISKLSYAMYLVHFNWIVSGTYMSSRVLYHYSQATIINIFWSVFMITIMVAFVFSAVFESPVLVIEKHLLGGNKSKNEEKKTLPT